MLFIDSQILTTTIAYWVFYHDLLITELHYIDQGALGWESHTSDWLVSSTIGLKKYFWTPVELDLKMVFWEFLNMLE